MAYAEQLYDEDFPYRGIEEVDTSFHRDSLLLRRWDLVEDGWREFLDMHEASSHLSARAYSAANWADYINWQIEDQGLDADIKSDAAIMPLLLNDTIGYIAHSELLNHYRRQGVKVENSHKQAYLGAERGFREKTKDYLSLFHGRAKTKAYLGLAGTFDYASLVVLGPASSNRKKNGIHDQLKRGLPTLEARVALRPRGWAHMLLREQSA